MVKSKPKVALTKELHRQHGDAHSRIEEVAKRAHRVVRPLLRAPPGRPAEQLGSGVFLQIDEARFLLTAAHVLDRFGSDPIYAAGDGVIVPLAGPTERTDPPIGTNREHDRIDAAVLRLTHDFGSPPGIAFLRPNETDVREWMNPAPHYLLYGYPESKTKIDLPTLRIRGDRVQVLSPRAAASAFEAAGVHPDLHVVFELTPKAMVSDTGVRAMPSPHGMSGCGVWAIRGLDEEDAPIEARLVGIFNETPLGTIHAVAARLCYHFELIRLAWPEYGERLPQHGRAPIRLRRAPSAAT